MAKKKATRKKASRKKPALKGLAAYFSEDLFLPDMKARNKADAFEELVDSLGSQLGKHNKQTLLSMLHHREMLGTTGVGKGIAVPHGRTLLTRQLRIVFGKSAKGIDYGARDDQPVHLVFLVVAPFQDRGNVYLPTLGKIIEHVRLKPGRDSLSEVETFEDLVKILEQIE